jgi:hypothetical protein
MQVVAAGPGKHPIEELSISGMLVQETYLSPPWLCFMPVRHRLVEGSLRMRHVVTRGRLMAASSTKIVERALIRGATCCRDHAAVLKIP